MPNMRLHPTAVLGSMNGRELAAVRYADEYRLRPPCENDWSQQSWWQWPRCCRG